MATLFDWMSGHWLMIVIVAVFGIAILALETVVWILSHSD
jgi:hypothetical protein